MRHLLCILWICLLTSTAPAASAPDFEREVIPILYNHCWSCHSEKQAKAGLRLDSVHGIRTGDVLEPGHPEDSELFARVSLNVTDKDVMPPLKGGAQPLNDKERDVLRRWIAAGAQFGTWKRFEHRGTVREPQLHSETPQAFAERVDRFVENHHQKNGTALNPPISDEAFVRRIYLDVAGRIPTLEERTRFLENKAPDRRGILIDQLLNSAGFTSHFFNWKADQLRLISLGIPGQPGWLYDEWVKNAVRSRMPYDEFVRQLLTAKGYLWDTGAVGFFIRDLGMPLDHMSNLSRIFLGTRMECAQCHDHPLQPVTQKDFFQMTAFTAGVTNLASSTGYSEKNVRQWPELKEKMDAVHADSALRQSVSRTISFLKRITADTDTPLLFPGTAEKSLRGRPAQPQTFFGDPVSAEKPREAFAQWMTSPRNPRFSKNIANRLWRFVFGAGLVEPVDSLSALPDGAHSELLQCISDAMTSFRYDERALLAGLLRTRLYQSQSVREPQDPGTSLELRGPLLRRLSAEQIWDSLLSFLVPDLDERASLRRNDGTMLDPDRLRNLTTMTADELLQRARDEKDYRERDRQFKLRLREQEDELKSAGPDPARLKSLKADHARENAAFFSPRLKTLSMGPAYHAEETDPRWLRLPSDWVRASETPLPLPPSHFLRLFGQSDRREIDAFNRDPQITHALALMNGKLTSSILAPDSFLNRQLSSLKGPALFEKIFEAVLIRSATPEEFGVVSAPAMNAQTSAQALVWALLNSPEFLFQY